MRPTVRKRRYKGKERQKQKGISQTPNSLPGSYLWLELNY